MPLVSFLITSLGKVLSPLSIFKTKHIFFINKVYLSKIDKSKMFLLLDGYKIKNFRTNQQNVLTNTF